MSRNNRLGQIRRSQVLGYGPGAIIDFRAGAMGGGPVSVISASLESWDDTAKPAGNSDPHIVHEERLQKVLGKQYFRLPPIDDSDEGEDLKRWLRGYRFPQWLQCPSCKELRYASKWAKDPGDPSRWCARCSDKDRRSFVVPLRFVTACENGHIDEFPWQWWLRTRSTVPPSCSADDEGGGSCRLVLESVGGSGLEGLVLRCINKGCGARASLAGAFSGDSLKGLSCAGRRPWLTRDHAACSARPRTLQRGASNLYFPVTYSTLSIPPWTDGIQDDIRPFWETLKARTGEVRDLLIDSLAQTQANQHGMTPEAYASVIRTRLELDEGTSLETLRVEEYARLTADAEGDNHTFQIRQEKAPEAIAPYIEYLARVERLREVRALTGFKRIYQPVSVEDPGQGLFGDLCDPAAPVPWLPAAEVRGEGIFFTLRRSFVDEWLQQDGVAERTHAVTQAAEAHWASHYGDAGSAPKITPTRLLVHSLAHAVIKRLSFECGYDVASLRERLYVGEEPWMAGILIYTSTSDADGTLGGLERQGKPERFGQILTVALHDAVWCSSDPLCRSGVCSTSESMNLAACHSCLLLPETCCEEGNRFLDRSMLVTDAADADTGFFNALLHDEGS